MLFYCLNNVCNMIHLVAVEHAAENLMSQVCPGFPLLLGDKRNVSVHV